MPHYFDYAATQPMRQSAIDAWVAAAGSLNSGAQYGSGRKARSVLDLSLIHISEPTRLYPKSRLPSSA